MKSDSSPKTFGPPEITDLASLTDGRKPGEYASAYPASAWFQIILELIYLLGILCGSITLLSWLAIALVLRLADLPLPGWFGSVPENRTLIVWAAAALAGACGGAASALKWLYHSVAKQQWHRDRIVWRVVVPPLSAVLSVFAGLMVISGVIPIFGHTSFDNPATGAAFGFFVGFFSDNVLAFLQKLAYRIFGTVDENGE